MSRLRTAAQIAATRQGGRVALGYRAIEDSPSRRPTQPRTRSEIAILTPQKRERASATARDDRRNMTILAWMIRRHLDNVSRFTPQFRMPGDSPEIAAVNEVVNRLIRWHAHRKRFDVHGRHGRDEWMRMFEATKVIEGDCGGLKIKDGRLQGIEGDRIKRATLAVKGAKLPENVTDEGVTLSGDGAILGFSVCKRGDNGNMEFERLVPADQMVFDAYWPERFDSHRGVSPLLTALSEGADVRETREWLVLKAKASAIFGLAFTRTGSDDIMPTAGDPATSAPATEQAAYSAQVAAALKARGIINLDLDQGDEVKEIQSSTPNPGVVEFTRELIRSVLLALDIPFTFYDSLTASFSARIADRNEYEECCEWKREKNIGILDEIYGDWLLPMWYDADLFKFGKIAKTAGVTPEDVASFLRWVPAGRPWLDRSNEMSGHILALAAGVTSIPAICASYGEDAYKIAAEQKEYLEKCGIPILYAQGGQFSVQSLMQGKNRGDGEPPPQPTEVNDEQ